MNIIPIEDWGIFSKTPCIIAGPCSAENKNQTIQTAVELKNIGVEVFRAGVWKPRSRPNNFEGVGDVALDWLKEVKQLTGLKLAVEVAMPEHISKCLKSGVDVLWIGARTSVNPFAMIEIAKELNNIDIPILIKNPINPDINLWMGAIERIYKAGIRKLGVIHRGFSTYDKSQYRNLPLWELPIELKRRLPNIPILCDPSHICGSVENIYSVAQFALNLAYNGLIIESHINPSEALSDSRQQLNPFALNKLLNKLELRAQEIENTEFKNKIEVLRKKIDNLDEELLKILSERMEIAKQIGDYKKANNISVFQSNRWNDLLLNRINYGKELNLSEELILNIFNEIHNASINIQNDILKKK